MSLEGYLVTHKAFGEGRVLRADDRYITVRFADVEKTFVYPDAFKGFMTISDEEANAAILADLQRSDEKNARSRENRQRQIEMQKQRGVVIPGGRPLSERESTYSPVTVEEPTE